MTNKLCFIDVETTGLFPWKNAIHQLSGTIIIDQEVKEKFNFLIRPHDGAEIEVKALEVSGVTHETIMEYPDSISTFKAFIKMLDKYVGKYNKKDKFHFVAYNAQFDSEFIRSFFKRNKNNYYGSYFWTPYIDLMTIAGAALMSKRSEMTNFKLNTVANKLGINVDDSRLHDAEYDIELTVRIYVELLMPGVIFDNSILPDQL